MRTSRLEAFSDGVLAIIITVMVGKISPPIYIAGCVVAGLAGAGTGPFRPGIWIAVACYVAVAALWVIPDRRIETVITAESEPDPNKQG